MACALGATQIFSFGTSYYLLGVLAGPIQAETGWELAFLSAAQSAGMLVAGLASPAFGRMTDRGGGAGPLTIGFALFALGLLLIGVSPNKAVFVAGWLALGAGMGASFYDGVFAALGKVYGEKARPAITTVTLWGGFASTICWPLSAALIEPIGWRGVCLVYAAIHLALCIPLVRWSLKGTRQGAMPRAGEQTDARLAREDEPAFYLLMSISVVAGLTMTVLLVHFIALVQARGLALTAAVSLGALIGPAQVGARALDLMLGARHHPVWTLMASLGLMAVGVVLFATHFPIVGVAVILFAAGNGIYSIARGAVPLALFGSRHYAVVIGRLARPLFLAQAMAPTLGALAISWAGADATVWLLAAASLANLAAGVVLLRIVRR